MCVTKLLIPPVKKGFFAQKRPNLAQNWHFWSIWARLILCPVGGSVGGCGARAVSRKTPIYFMIHNDVHEMIYKNHIYIVVVYNKRSRKCIAYLGRRENI